MNFLTYLAKLQEYFLKFFKRKRPKISIIIPFSSDDPVRKATFEWLLKYWEKELPKAEIIVGYSSSGVFCKGEAMNRAIKKSRGKVIAILDADAYLEGKVLEYCANKILRHMNTKLWFVPYRNLYRLKKGITEKILDSDPSNPLRLPSPPSNAHIENAGHSTQYGRRYGAMCMIFPREAYDTLGCFDERFKGWGGEDIALLRALDTLYGKHKSVKTDILHLWHPFIGSTYQTRKWVGQESGNVNSKLSFAYHVATRSPSKMRKLVDEGCNCIK